VTDEQLLDAWRDGDATAGQDLLKRHFKALFRFFANKVSEEADDLIQKTMMRAVRGRDQFRGQSSFRSYLFVIARRELLRHYRTRQRDRLVFDPEVSSVFDLSGSPSSMAAKSQEQKLLLDALRRLPVDLQVALELHYWEDLSTAELAGILEIPQGTVKSRLRRAREALVTAIEQLSTDPQQRRETIDNLDQWAREVRAQAVG
jgi:RNA polymerase sigma-70 factor (ECF subfamily)